MVGFEPSTLSVLTCCSDGDAVADFLPSAAPGDTLALIISKILLHRATIHVQLDLQLPDGGLGVDVAGLRVLETRHQLFVAAEVEVQRMRGPACESGWFVAKNERRRRFLEEDWCGLVETRSGRQDVRQQQVL